jgi:hypothetical protein
MRETRNFSASFIAMAIKKIEMQCKKIEHGLQRMSFED